MHDEAFFKEREKKDWEERKKAEEKWFQYCPDNFIQFNKVVGVYDSITIFLHKISEEHKEKPWQILLDSCSISKMDSLKIFDWIKGLKNVVVKSKVNIHKFKGNNGELISFWIDTLQNEEAPSVYISDYYFFDGEISNGVIWRYKLFKEMDAM